MIPALLVAGWVLAAGLAIALAGAARRSRVRAELAARARHELRGPLTGAELALHGLARRGLPVDPVQGELARARLALADLEAAAAGGHGPERRRPVDVGTLLERHAPAWAAAAAAAGARLELRLPPAHARTLVHGDAVRIAQAVANLVGNAVEHAGGDVRVAVRATRATVAIEVRDDGPGLPAPVAQLARGPRDGRGARGRGLAIAAAIAARHGGRLATAPAATGARLVLELPAARAGAAGSRGRAAAARAAAVAQEAVPPSGAATKSTGLRAALPEVAADRGRSPRSAEGRARRPESR